MDKMDSDHIVQCWFRFLHVLSNPVDLSRPHIIANTQQFLQATLTSSDVPALHQVECLRQLPTIFFRAMCCIATIVDAFLGKVLQLLLIFPVKLSAAKQARQFDALLTDSSRVRVRVIEHLYSALLWDEPIARHSYMACDSKGITQFYLQPTHEPYLRLLPSRRASPPFGWYSVLYAL